AVNGGFLYTFVAGDTGYPLVSYNDGTWHHEKLGARTDAGVMAYTGQLAVPAYRSAGKANSGGYLNFRGRYRVAVKYYNPTREVYTGMSVVLEADVSDQSYTTGNAILYGLTVHDYITGAAADHLPDTFTKIEIYRSLNMNDPLDPYQGGVLYLEQTIDSAGQGDTTAQVGKLPDVALVQQKRYDPWADPMEEPPDSGACAVYEDILIAGRDSDDNGGIGLVWTNPNRRGMEEFATECKYDGDTIDGIVKKIIVTNSAAYAFTDLVIYKILKSGGDVVVGRLRKGKSIVTDHAVIAIDEDVLMVTQQGLVLMDNTGSMRQIITFDRIFLEEWQGNFDDITMAYDAMMGCIYVLCPCNAHSYSSYGVAQMACIWEATQRITMLEGVPFIAAACGPDVTQATDACRAYFVDELQRIVTPNYDRTYNAGDDDGYVGTMTGRKSVDDNGEVGVGGLDMSAYDAGRMIYMYDGAYAGTWYYCDGASTLTAESLGVGSHFALDPIKMMLRLPPVRESTNLPLFGRKNIKSIGVKCTRFTERSGSGSSGHTECTLGVYKNAAGLASDSAKKTVAVTGTTNPPDMTKSINQDGITVEPFFENVSGCVDIEITGFKISAVVTISKEAAA
ncbi:MAG: hypothetical protein AMJ79_15565, partial [Phycisphaerae bacterium SM23_30]